MKIGDYETNNIYNEDCYEAIKKIPDKSVDLVIIDPPYEITNGVHESGFLKNRKQLDTTKQIFDKKLDIGCENAILNQLCRVMKQINIYIWCNKKQLFQYLDYFKDKDVMFEMIIWNKYNCIPLTCNTYLPDKEYCLFFKEKGIKLHNTYETSKTIYNIPINVEDKQKYSHPTIKPLNIIKNLVVNSSCKNDVVLDCFMGSGTTAVACKETGRQYIGFEIDKEYFKIAQDRLNGIEKSGQTTLDLFSEQTSMEFEDE